MLALIFAVFGGAIGSVLFRDFAGFATGAVVGSLAAAVLALGSRVTKLERLIEATRPSAEAHPAAATVPRIPATPAMPAARPAPLADEPAPTPAPPFVAAPAAASTPRSPRRPAPAQRAPSPLDALFASVLRWSTTGNVPVKVGVVLSLFGVGFLVKEGIDREWLVLPIEVRLVLVALFGIGLLALGWRLRTSQRAYALPVQGGGIGVLYVTIYASFAIYGLLPAPLAFGLLVAVTAAAGVLAVLQDAHALAVLGILGGFLAPVLASTDSGNHVALFGYYAVLDVAIFAIAWFKAWRALNVLGFAFTFGIGTLWGIDAYEPELFATTEPFLVLFTALYLVIPVLFAQRVEPKLRGFVDGTLVFGTPIVAFALQSELVADTEYGLAISAVALALVYFGMAAYLSRTQGETLRVLVEAQRALAVAFATVAVPLALDERFTSAAWALQGAALVWLAFRQQRRLALLAGLALQSLSAAAYFDQPWGEPSWPIVNGYTWGALLLALAGMFSSRIADPARPAPLLHRSLEPWAAKALSIGLFAWGSGWWLFGGFAEIARSVGSEARFVSMLVFAAATTLLSMRLAPRIAWPRLTWLGVSLWPLAALLAVVAAFSFAHPAEDYGWLGWPLAFGAMLSFLRHREGALGRLAGALHVLAYWLAMSLVAWEAGWLVDRVASGVWPEAAVLALVAVLLIATLRASSAVAWPFTRHARAYVVAGAGAVLVVLVLGTFVLNLESPGDSAPLPYLPLVNPLELASLLALMALLEWLGAARAHGAALSGLERCRPAVAAVAGWFLVTMSVARSVHHFAGVPYDFASLAESTALQSSLSIVWGIAGLAAMVVGARALRRAVWLAGAVLMGVVVAKLFLIDLGNTDTLARVVSFLGVGVLLLAVGYFAPVPPRAEAVARPA